MILETTAEWRQRRGVELLQQIDRDLSDRSAWENDRLVTRRLYYGDGVTRPDIHFKGASDIHFPVLTEQVERIVPKMNQAFWGAHPHVMVDRVPEEYDPEDTRIQEAFINWAVEFDIEDLFHTTHVWFRNMLLDGNSSLETRWVTTWRRTCETHRVRMEFRKGEVSPTGFLINEQGRPKTTADVLDELFGSEQWEPHSQDEDGTIHLSIVEDRRPIDDVRVKMETSKQFVDELDILVYRPILVEDRPRVRPVEPDKLILPFRARHVQTARRVAYEHGLTVDQVMLNARQDQFDPWILVEGDEDSLKAAAASKVPGKVDVTENEAFGRHRDDVAGVRQGSAADPTNSELTFYEVYLSEDVDGDGQREEIVVQLSRDLQRIVHATYLDTVHPHGRRPFPTIHFMAPSDRWYVPGLGHFIAPLNIQTNITINQINDRQTLINNPIGFYRPMALPQDPDSVRSLVPGDMIPSPDPSGIVFPDWGKAPLADMSIMDSVLMFADRLGASPVMGGSSQMSNMPRTARGTLALISEGNLKIDVLIDMAQRGGMYELMQQLFGLYSTFMPSEKYFWATGHSPRRTPEMMSRKLMRGRYQFKFRGNTVNTNPEVQRTLAQIRYQVASLNPLYLQDPVKLRELLRDFLQAHSDGTSVERILPDLPGQGAEPHPPMPQAMENIAIRMHQPTAVIWSDNHLKHMQDIEAQIAAPDFDEWDEVAVALLAQHYNEHRQGAARASQMAALNTQTAGGGEQSQGRAMADMGLGNLEGGVA